MTDYPEWLIRKVAEAGARGVDECDGLYSRNADGSGKPHSIDYIEEWEKGAREILDALGFKEVEGRGTLAGHILMWSWPAEGGTRHTRWAASTEWREDEGRA